MRWWAPSWVVSGRYRSAPSKRDTAGTPQAKVASTLPLAAAFDPDCPGRSRLPDCPTARLPDCPALSNSALDLIVNAPDRNRRLLFCQEPSPVRSPVGLFRGVIDGKTECVQSFGLGRNRNQCIAEGDQLFA